MKQYKDLFFDLDGTLADTWEGVSRAVCYALGKCGAPIPPRGALRRFLGPPLEWSFREYCGFDTQGTETAIGFFREYYRETGIRQLTLYPGIPEMLDALGRAGYRLSVATSKIETSTKQILADTGILGCFAFVGAAEDNGARNDKEGVIRYCLSSLPEAKAETTLMIGDRLHDADGAHAAGLDVLGALWGFGSEEELRSHGVSLLARTPGEVVKILSEKGEES